jgi:diguanylate cyclase (GGDEF)-like protein
MCDVDHFKHYNDTHGHEVGDAVLVDLAKALRQFCRRGGDLAVRLGGDEFALLLPGVRSTNVSGLADDLRSAARALEVSRRVARITLSIGAATFGGAETCPTERLLSAADGALYQAKHAGRDRVVARCVPD